MVDKKKQPRSLSQENTILAGQLGAAIKTETSKRPEQIAAYRQMIAAQRDLQRKLHIMGRRKSSLLKQPGCFSSTSVYGGSGAGKNTWLCNIDRQIRYKEGTWKVHSSEVRIFVEGAEVSPYIRGTVEWSIETTGGINGCSFTLNNNQDGFVITPMNVCSNIDPKGWMLAKDRRGHIATAPYRDSIHTDEWAKYKIYREKYMRMHIGTDKQQIDKTGMWLYPLNPYGCIFNKHDCVRIFYRLPHVSGAVHKVNKHIKDYKELWVPAFTGFIDKYDIIDDPPNGDRSINISCYDYRGILNRMRVRVQGSPVSSSQKSVSSTKPGNTAANRIQRGVESSSVFVDLEKLGIDLRWLRNITNRDIALEFINLFKTAFDAQLISGNCKNKSKYDVECAKNLYKELVNRVRSNIIDFYKTYKKAEESIKRANNVDGGTRKFVLKPKSNGKLIIENGVSRAGADFEKTINETIGFLNTSGITIITAAEELDANFAVIKNKDWQHFCSATKFMYNLFYSTDPIYSILNNMFSSIQDKKLETLVKWDQKETSDSINDLYASVAKSIGVKSTSNVSWCFANKGYTFTGYYVPYTGNMVPVFRTYVLSYVQEKIKSRLPKAKGKRDFVEKSRRELEKYIKKYVGSDITDTTNTINVSQVKNLAKALKEYNIKYVRPTLGNAETRWKPLLTELNDQLNNIRKALEKENKRMERKEKESQNVRAVNNVEQIRTRVHRELQKGRDNAIKQSEAGAVMADYVKTDVQFSEANAGMYQDLVNALDRDAHPLAGMSYETAVKWLTLTHLPTSMGIEYNMDRYDAKKLQKWNKIALFGILGRPLTRREVTVIGHGTVSDLGEDRVFSPLQSFVHILYPKGGTGASTIVQQNITHPTGTDKSYKYSTRLSLLNEISDKLDYQFYVSPMGDFIFEFPMYDSIPKDWGPVFSGAYIAAKELVSSRITPEVGPMYTAWVVSGTEHDVALDTVASGSVVKNLINKKVIVAPILAKRIGAMVKHINIKIPGLSAILGQGAGMGSILAYAYLEIQKDIGNMSTMGITVPFRPYLLPNRPIHLVHRQRIGLIKSVKYTMSPPDGNCGVNIDISYVRELFRDGSFRTIVGGKRLPIDYSGLFTGDIRYKIRWGVSKASTCGPLLKTKYVDAGAFFVDRMTDLQKSGYYSSTTTGSNGQAGEIPSYLLRGMHGGSSSFRLSRKPPNPGEKGQAITTKDTGLYAGEDKRYESDSPQYNVRKLFYNPYPLAFTLASPASVKGAISPFSAFGPIRKFSVDRKYGPHERWHNGVDIMVPLGTPIHVPFDVTYGRVCMPTGWRYTEKVAVEVDDTGFAKYTPFIIKTVSTKSVLNKVNGVYLTPKTIRKVIIDNAMYKRYKKYAEKGGKPIVAPKQAGGYSNRAGMVMELTGDITLPKDDTKKVRVTLSLCHLNDIALIPDDSNRYFLMGSGRTPKAKEIVAYVGKTGNTSHNNTPHGHIELIIHNGNKVTDPSALQEVIKANKEYLRTALAIQITGNHVKGSKIRPVWQRYFNHINRTRKKNGKPPINTVDDALDYLLRPSSWAYRYKGKEGQNLSYKIAKMLGLAKGGIKTTAFFFFKPEDFFPQMTSEFQKYYKYVSDIFLYRPAKGTKAYSLCGSSVVSQERLSIFRQYNKCKKRARRSYRQNRRKRYAAYKQCKVVFNSAWTEHSNTLPTRRNANKPLRIAQRLDAAVAARDKEHRTTKEIKTYDRRV